MSQLSIFIPAQQLTRQQGRWLGDEEGVWDGSIRGWKNSLQETAGPIAVKEEAQLLTKWLRLRGQEIYKLKESGEEGKQEERKF